MRALDLIAGTEVVPELACWDMLSSQSIGRVAFFHGGRVEVFPVNYALHENQILFATNPGRKLNGLAQGEVVFEVDWIDSGSRSGWSVVIRGTARVVTEVDSAAGMIQMPWRSWAGTKDCMVIIQPQSITGRRVAPV